MWCAESKGAVRRYSWGFRVCGIEQCGVLKVKEQCGGTVGAFAYVVFSNVVCWNFTPHRLVQEGGKSSCQSSHNDKLQGCILEPIKCLVFLYGCETWSFTLREECSLRVFENRALRRIFGLKKDEVTEEGRKIRN
jgi:hypothetical protein